MGKKNKVIYDSLVIRDKNIIDLLEVVDVATREQIQRALFKNVHINVPMRRLTFLTDNKLIKRDYYQLEQHKNLYVYYPVGAKKPKKRNIKHNIMVTEFITKVMDLSEVIEVKTHYHIGNIIADAFIEYKDSENKVRRLFLEVQLSNKVEDTTSKYKDIKNIILENRPKWQTIPRLIVITNLEHNQEQQKGLKIKYDTTDMQNIRELIF